MAKIQEVTKVAKDGTRVTLFTPGLDDAAEILATMQIVIDVSPHLLITTPEFTFTVEQQKEIVQKHFDHPDKVMIVPRVDGRIVGMMNFGVGMRNRIAHWGSFGMSLLPEFTGRGIGRIMLETLLDWAAAHPRVETVRLQVHARNTNAIALYHSCGFTDEGRESRGVKFVDGTYDDVISMAKHVK